MNPRTKDILETLGDVIAGILILGLSLAKEVLALVLVFTITLTWLFGFVIAKGFWSTFFCIIPFYSWYLTVEYITKHFGLI